ncbi:MAG: putative integrase, catalytic subunit [Microgenomates group bacterium Gr01-1014_7]|nr:MAG: putative integrase, catalytic subunit [Microgenomates group bacterium Gr01-1014_7]
MIDTNLNNFNALGKFLTGIPPVKFSGGSKKQKYEWVKEVLVRFNFRKLRKGKRGEVREYIQKITGYSNAQLSRLIAKYLKGKLYFVEYQRNSFPTRYSPADITLLCKTDNIHQRLNGYATRQILIRECQKYGKAEYEKISQISVAHIYRLRTTRIYLSKSLTFKNTQAVQRNIGERAKPQPNGKPGYIRIDTVHQGDLASELGSGDGVKEQKYVKGVYHINSVDEVTQWEIIASVEQISESYLEPILKLILEQYPFLIVEFHADNGSEYINHTVAKLLNKLLIKLTKSRARQTNDNALVESKNGSIIRKHMGYFYIHQKYAPEINDFYLKVFNPYLNFHRPCGFATTTTDSRGKQKKIYKTYLTPYEALKNIPDAKKYLKPGITFNQLDKISMQHSDNEYASIMDEEKTKLFDKIGLKPIDF